MAISRRMQEGASQVPKKGAGTKSPEFDGFLSGRSGRGGGFCWKAWLEPAVFGKLKGRQAFWKDHTCVLKARLLCTVSYVRPWTAARESVPTEPLVWQVRPVAPFDLDFERGSWLWQAIDHLWSHTWSMIMQSWKFPQTQPERHLVLLSSENPRRGSSLFTTMHGVAPTANSSAKKH